MLRQAARGLLALAAITLLVETSIGQPPAATPDKITVRNKDGTTKNYDGNLQFTPAGLQIVSPEKKALLVVAPGDILKVVPGEMPGIDRGVLLGLISTEDKKTKADYTAARLGYQDMKKKAVTAPERAKRFLDFKLAQLTNRIADETGRDEKWSDVAGEAAKGWTEFIAEYKSGWEVWPAARSASRLYAEMNKFDDVARTWNRLTKKEVGLPADLLLEAQMQEIDANIRSKTGAATAQVAADALEKAAPAGTNKDKLAIYSLAAKAIAGGDAASGVKGIEEKINATKDATTRGVGYGMLGELYMAAGRPRDAMWAYMWVETVYNADKDEAFKAMCRLVEVFQAQMDDDRVRLYHDKLRRARGNF